MTLVDGFAPPLPLQAMLVVRKTTETKNSLYHNQHFSVGGRGGTIILSYGWSHHFCEGLRFLLRNFGPILTYKAKITRKLF